MSKTVGEVMTPGARTVDADMSIEDVARKMHRWDVRELFVTEDGTLRGALTDTDIIVLAIASGHPPSSLQAGLSCDPKVPRAQLDQPVADALDQMRRHDRCSLPVVDTDDHLVGIAWIDDVAAGGEPLTASTGG